MVDFMKPIREELRKFENDLENDIHEFNSKLNLSQQNLFNYIDQQIEYLINIKKEYNDQFNYLNEENIKTSRDNQQEFNKLCLTINQNDHNSIIVYKLFEDFKQKFQMRPKILKSIPQFDLKDIHINDFIIKQGSQSNIDSNSSSPLHNDQLSTQHSETFDQSFIPVTSPTTSIGFSSHKQFAPQTNENDIEPQSRLVSRCSTISGVDNMIDMLFKIPYQHNRSPCLMCFNEDENCLLIYSISSHQLEYLTFNSHQISLINVPFNESILNLGYSIRYHSFYLITRKTNRFVFFRLNEKEKQIEIEQEIKLINEKDHFIRVHIYQNLIFFLYLSSSSIVSFGKYHLDNSSFLPSISFEKKLYDHEDKSSYKIIDFTINNSFIIFLIKLKNENKYKILIYDYETMTKIHSFQLIDAIKPSAIISTEKKSKSTTSNDQIEFLLFVHDLQSHLIHCCSNQEYLIPIQVNAFAICPLNDGNLSFISTKDIRGLNIQEYLKCNNV